MLNQVPKHTSSLKKSLLIGAGVLLAIAIVVTALEVTDTTHVFHANDSETFVTVPTKGGASENNDKGEIQKTKDNSTDTAKGQPGDTKSNTGGADLGTLITPSGDFVSNHYPSLSGNAPNIITSVCTTTPGATCYIRFTQGSTILKLPSQTTDRGGSAYWNNWKLQDVGLSQGSWQVQAVATANGQSAVATDALNVEVAP